MPAQSRVRRLVYGAFLMAGAACVALGAVGSTLSRSVFDPVAFGDRAAASLSDPRVAAFAANQITNAVLEQSPDLTAVRPLILGAAEGLAASDPMRGVVRTAARTAHRTLFAEGTRQVVLSIPDVGILLRSAFERASPELAKRIPESLQAIAASLDASGSTQIVIDLWELRDELRRSDLDPPADRSAAARGRRRAGGGPPSRAGGSGRGPARSRPAAGRGAATGKPGGLPSGGGSARQRRAGRTLEHLPRRTRQLGTPARRPRPALHRRGDVAPRQLRSRRLARREPAARSPRRPHRRGSGWPGHSASSSPGCSPASPRSPCSRASPS